MRVRLRLDRLRELMARSNRTQNHWAIKIGLSRGHWSQIVNGKHPYISARTRERLLEAFAVAFDELFEVEDAPVTTTEATFRAAIAEEYQIERQIGEGGMGTVYLARDVKHSRMVAVKVVSREAVSGIGATQFLKEIRYMSRLRHHHVLPIFDSGQAAGHPYYITPLVDGGSLRELLERRGALPIDEAIGIVRGVAKALQYAHDRRVLHCDIKPENILLSDDHAYVADFGISRAIHAEVFEWGMRRELDSSAGTPAYVSPEQASGERNLDARSDVYSLACVLFEMLAGRPPFAGRTTMEVVSQRFVDEPPDLRVAAPEVPDAAAAVVRSAMGVEPSERPATIMQLIDDFESAAREPASGTTRIVRQARGAVSRSFHSMLVAIRSRQGPALEGVTQDLSHAVRALVRKPTLALVGIATLALGIGMNVAMFSMMYTAVLQPLPYSDADRLVRIGRTHPDVPRGYIQISSGAFVRVRERVSTMEEVIGMIRGTYNVTGTGDAARILGARVTAGFFTAFGVPLALGRDFSPDDDVAGAPPVTILGYELWRDRFGSDRNVLSQTFVIDGVTHTIIGVAPEGFRVQRVNAVWMPHAWDADDLAQTGFSAVRAYGRLGPGVTLEQARADLESVWRGIAGDDATQREYGLSAISLHEFLTRAARRSMLLLTGAVALVLLVACANVANIMLAWAESRRRDLSIRSALGAGRLRLVRQYATESGLVALIGGATGIVTAWAGLQVLLNAFPQAIPHSDRVALHAPVLGYALLVALGTGVLVGLIPAVQTEPNHDALRSSGRGVAGGNTLLRNTLVTVEMALALILVTGTGLLLRSFWHAQGESLGFDQESVVTFRVSPPVDRYVEIANTQAFYDDLQERLAGVPAVVDVGMSHVVPLSGGRWNAHLDVVGQPERSQTFVEYRSVTSGFFRTMGIPLVTGRAFAESDRTGSPPVAIVNQSLARAMFGTGDPLGQRISGVGPDATVIGVAGDVRRFGPDRPAPPTLYVAYDQLPFRNMAITVRTQSDPRALLPVIRDIVRDLDSQLPVYALATMEDMVDQALGSRSFQLTMIGLFAAVALALGIVGIYGVMSYTVEQRTREVGIRLALGAEPHRIRSMVLRQGGRLAGIGALLGLAGAGAANRMLASQLYEVNAVDPATYAAVVLLLVGAALAACYVPAVRATRADPLQVLRSE